MAKFVYMNKKKKMNIPIFVFYIYVNLALLSHFKMFYMCCILSSALSNTIASICIYCLFFSFRPNIVMVEQQFEVEREE